MRVHNHSMVAREVRSGDGGKVAGTVVKRPVAAERPTWWPAGAAAFWYRIGHGHTRVIYATDEDAAREAILARFPWAHGQRVELQPVRR